MDTRRVEALAGFMGPVLFAAIFTTEGWLRPGYPSSSITSSLGLVKSVSTAPVGVTSAPAGVTSGQSERPPQPPSPG
jgi:hypothetical protein